MKNSPEIVNIIERAKDAAVQRQQTLCLVEHVLLALVSHPPFKKCLESFHVDSDGLQEEIESYLDSLVSIKSATPIEPSRTRALENVIRRATTQVELSGRSSMTTIDLCMSIMCEEKTHAQFFLKKYGVTKQEFLEHWQNSYAGPEYSSISNTQADKILTEYTTNLTELARKNRLDPVIGRHKEVDELINVLAKRIKANALLIGDPGVGKTSIVDGLASLIVEGSVPEFLRDHEVYSLEIGALLAGSKYRGEFEEKVKNVLEALVSKKTAILFIDEAHTMQGAGGSTTGSVDFSNMIKPAITKGNLKVIASTTWEEFYESFEKDRALMRRFFKISIDEPSTESTIRILSGLSSKLEEFHNVVISPDAITTAVEAAGRYIPDRKNPDKSIDLLDAACAKQRVLDTNGVTITKEMIYEQVERYTGVPATKMNSDNFERISALDLNMKSKIFGQDEALQQILDRVYVSFAGIGNESKPIASFLLSGPSGSGKTETCKQLAQNLDMPLIKFDMSEFAEKHAVSSLIGPPPGYVGFNDSQVQGGRLISELSKHPHAILLFDEVEKAHPDIFNIFLQMLDEGRITGTNGKEVSCKNTIIVMTSNLGSAANDMNSIGFGSLEKTGEDDKAIKVFFKPEMRNRIDVICKFNKLAPESIKQIVHKFTDELTTTVSSKHNVTLNFSDDAIQYLADNGYDSKLGARPLGREVDAKVRIPLAKKILFERLSDVNIMVDSIDGNIDFIITAKPEIIINADGTVDTITA